MSRYLTAAPIALVLLLGSGHHPQRAKTHVRSYRISCLMYGEFGGDAHKVYCWGHKDSVRSNPLYR